jgi:hypothetical protein
MKSRACVGLRRAIRWGIVSAALLAPFAVGACIDDHEAEQCVYTFSCPPPDAGDGGDASMDANDHGDDE